MLHTDKAIHKYKIEITGGSDIATLEPGLIDFIDLKISSMQKVGN